MPPPAFFSYCFLLLRSENAMEREEFIPSLQRPPVPLTLTAQPKRPALVCGIIELCRALSLAVPC